MLLLLTACVPLNNKGLVCLGGLCHCRLISIKQNSVNNVKNIGRQAERNVVESKGLINYAVQVLCIL